MQDIKVTTVVHLPSGAEVTLTDHQLSEVSKMVNQMLFSTPEVVKVKRAYKRKKKYQQWTKEEDELLMPLVNITDKSEAMKYYKSIKRQINRGSNAIYGRVYVLRKHKTVIPVTNFL